MSLENGSDQISRRLWLRTILAAAGPVLMFLFFGLFEAQSATMLPQLKKAGSSVPVTPDEETWIASIGLIATPIAALLTGPFVDVFGRKMGLKSFYFIATLGYAVIASAKTVYQIYIGRVLCGFGAGQISCAVIYLAEISTPRQREYFFAITTTTVGVGATVSSIIGGYLPWYVASFLYSITTFFLFIIVCFIPETPPWLFKEGKEEAAIRSLQKLGRSEAEAQQESETFKLQSKHDPEEWNWRAFLEPTIWKPFVIMTTFFFLSTATGIPILFFYTVDFVQRLRTNYDPVTVAVILSIVRLLTSCTIVIYFRSRVSRRMATVLSSLGMVVALVAVVAYDRVNFDIHTSEKPFQWLPVVSAAVYMTTSILGMVGLPFVMSGEVFPLKFRGTMTNTITALGLFFALIFVKMYYALIDALQFDGLLLLFAGSAFLGVPFAIYILPETQNKSLHEIQQSFLPKKRQLQASAPKDIKETSVCTIHL